MNDPFLAQISYVRVGTVDSEGIHREFDVVLSGTTISVNTNYGTAPEVYNEEDFMKIQSRIIKHIEVTINGYANDREPWFVVREETHD